MSQVETTLTVTLTGAIAEWLQQEADHNTRTPSQQVEHWLTQRKQGNERRQQATKERRAKHLALFGR